MWVPGDARRRIGENGLVLTEAALVALSNAIVAKAGSAAALTVGQTVRNRLQGDAVERAVCVALRSALARLERDHAALHNQALFDEHLLKTAGAAALLARYLGSGERPRPEELAEEWSRQFWSGSRRPAGDEVTNAARDFLIWFEEELRSQDALRAVLDSRAADETAKASASIADHLAAQARRGLIDPRPLYRELELEYFTGREWLQRELAAFLGREPSGCFVLEGGPGVGKSTFLAWLARERGYVQHFVRLAAGPNDTTAAMSNLAAQLAGEWRLSSGLLGPNMRRDEFSRVLEDAAKARDERLPRRRIVIVIDGLDEASPPSLGENVLGLPRTLPRGVYLVVSQQPVDVPLNIRPRFLFALSAQDPRQRLDLHRYLEAAAGRPAVVAALREAGIGVAQLVDAMLLKSSGVWLYAYFVLGEIERGERTVEHLDDLPFGLWQYYAEHWRRRREREPVRWEQFDLPLLATLAASQEPLTVAILSELAGVIDDGTVARILNEWEPFLERVEDDKPRYRLFHDSLRAFLNGHTVSGLHRGERATVEQLADTARHAHERIATRYVEAWGGLDANLPGLREERGQELDAGYGVRHLTAHLEAAGRVQQLPELLAAEWVSDSGPVSAWYTAHVQVADYAGYLSDVMRAWRLARRATERAVAAAEEAVSAGDEIGYALLVASITDEHDFTMPAELRAALLRHHFWTATEAIADVYSIADGAQVVDALVALAPDLSPDMFDQALDHVLAAALVTSDEQRRTDVLAALAPQLRGTQLDQVFEAACVMPSASSRVRALAALAQHLEGERLDQALEEALDAARQLTPESSTVQGLVALAPRLTGDRLDQALDTVLAITAQYWRAHALAALAPQLTGDRVGRALDAGGTINVESWRAEVLAALAPQLSGDQVDQTLDAVSGITSAFSRARVLVALAPQLLGDRLDRAFDAALSISYASQRARALAALAPQLAGDRLEHALEEALDATRAITADDWRARVLAALAPSLRGPHLDKALEATRAITIGNLRADAVASLAPHLTANRLDEALGEAVEAARAMPAPVSRALALAKLAPHLGDEALDEALDAARALYDPQARLYALRALVPQQEKVLATASWGDLLETAAFLGQPECYRVAGAVLPIIEEVAGAQALTRAVWWVSTAARWWPPSRTGPEESVSA